MIALNIYIVNLIVCVYGLILFLWWWNKTKKATVVYIYVTLIFAAEVIEKATHFWSGNILINYHDESRFVDIMTSNLWLISIVPSLLVYLIMVVAMTARICKTYKAANRSRGDFKPPMTSRNVFVISEVFETRSFMGGLFLTNEVEYFQAESVVEGIEKIVASSKQFSVIFVGLSAVDSSGMQAKDIVQIIKNENPWCKIIAMTRTPNSYELLGVRRSDFDDYLYLPVNRSILLASYDRWLACVKRWRGIEIRERRAKNNKKDLASRSGLEVRIEDKHKKEEEKEK